MLRGKGLLPLLIILAGFGQSFSYSSISTAYAASATPTPTPAASASYSPLYGVIVDTVKSFDECGFQESDFEKEYSHPSLQPPSGQTNDERLTIANCQISRSSALSDEINDKVQSLIEDLREFQINDGPLTSDTPGSVVNPGNYSRAAFFTADTSGNYTLTDTGVTEWNKIQDERNLINSDFISLYKLNFILAAQVNRQDNSVASINKSLSLDFINPPHSLSTLSGYAVVRPSQAILENPSTLTEDQMIALLQKKITYGTDPSLKNFAASYALFYHLTDPVNPGQGAGVINGSNGPAMVAVKNSAAALTAASVDYCGTQPNFILHPEDNVKWAICGAVVAFRPIPKYLLLSSTQLLAATANIGQYDLSKTIFSFAETSFQGNIQTSMVSTDTNTEGPAIRIAYDQILGLLNFILILAFILMAVSNILQIQVSNYSVGKLLPKIVIGFILAHASFFIVRAALEVSGVVATSFFQINHDSSRPADPAPMTKFYNAFTQVTGVEGTQPGQLFVGTTIDINELFKQVFLNLFIIVAAILIFILDFLFMIRALIFAFLVPLAPIAFFGQQVPPLQFVWKRWWGTAQGWIFMPVIANFWIWLAYLWFTTGNANQVGWFYALLNYIFGILAIYLAMTTPFKFAGEAKAVLERYNAMGRNAALSYTPYGSIRRKANELKNQYETSSKEKLEGEVFKSKFARSIGGDWYNRGNARKKLRIEQNKTYQTKQGEKVKNAAEEQLIRGMGMVAAERLKQYEVTRGLGNKIESSSKKIAEAFEKLENTPVLGSTLIKGRTYLGRQDDIELISSDANLSHLKSEIKKSFSYVGGRGNDKEKIRRAEHESTAEILKEKPQDIRADARTEYEHQFNRDVVWSKENTREKRDEHGDVILDELTGRPIMESIYDPGNDPIEQERVKKITRAINAQGRKGSTEKARKLNNFELREGSGLKVWDRRQFGSKYDNPTDRNKTDGREVMQRILEKNLREQDLIGAQKQMDNLVGQSTFLRRAAGNSDLPIMEDVAKQLKMFAETSDIIRGDGTTIDALDAIINWKAAHPNAEISRQQAQALMQAFGRTGLGKRVEELEARDDYEGQPPPSSP